MDNSFLFTSCKLKSWNLSATYIYLQSWEISPELGDIETNAWKYLQNWEISPELGDIFRAGRYLQSWEISLELGDIFRAGRYLQSWEISSELGDIFRAGRYLQSWEISPELGDIETNAWSWYFVNLKIKSIFIAIIMLETICLT